MKLRNWMMDFCLQPNQTICDHLGVWCHVDVVFKPAFAKHAVPSMYPDNDRR